MTRVDDESQNIERLAWSSSAGVDGREAKMRAGVPAYMVLRKEQRDDMITRTRALDDMAMAMANWHWASGLLGAPGRPKWKNWTLQAALVLGMELTKSQPGSRAYEYASLTDEQREQQREYGARTRKHEGLVKKTLLFGWIRCANQLIPAASRA